jgi:hypothetical protein
MGEFDIRNTLIMPWSICVLKKLAHEKPYFSYERIQNTIYCDTTMKFEHKQRRCQGCVQYSSE